jgi:hypothetical protein
VASQRDEQAMRGAATQSGEPRYLGDAELRAISGEGVQNCDGPVERLHCLGTVILHRDTFHEAAYRLGFNIIRTPIRRLA